MESIFFMCANYNHRVTYIFVQLMRGSNTLCKQLRKCPLNSLRMIYDSFFFEMVMRGFNSAEIRVSS